MTEVLKLLRGMDFLSLRISFPAVPLLRNSRRKKKNYWWYLIARVVCVRGDAELCFAGMGLEKHRTVFLKVIQPFAEMSALKCDMIVCNLLQSPSVSATNQRSRVLHSGLIFAAPRASVVDVKI